MQFKRPLWVRFDVEDRFQPAPDFCLPRLEVSGQVCLSDYRGRTSLAVFFVPIRGRASAGELLESLDDHAGVYQAEGAQALVIYPPGEAGNTWASDTSIPRLEDTHGVVRAKYAGLMVAELVGDSDGLLFVLDQFGAPYAVLVGAEQAGSRHNDEVLSWLQFIGMQCPE